MQYTLTAAFYVFIMINNENIYQSDGHSLISKIASCPDEEKQKCRKRADLAMSNRGGWCIQQGIDTCKDDILDAATVCLNACGDTSAFDRLGNILSKKSQNSKSGGGGACQGGTSDAC